MAFLGIQGWAPLAPRSRGRRLLQALALSFPPALLALIALLFGANFGCSRPKSAPPLVLYCAAGIKAPAEGAARAYEKEYGVRVRLQFGASQTLLANLAITGDGDLYLPADESYLEMGRQKGLIAEVLPVASMRATLAVSKGNPKNVRGLADLKSLRVGQGNPDATAIGRLTRQALRQSGAWDDVERATVVFKPTVNDVANDIKIGAVDAGFVWDTLVAQDPALEQVQVPELQNVRAHLAVAVLQHSRNPTAALRFARYITSRDKGLKHFSANRFTVLEGDAWEESPQLVLYSGAMNRVAVDDTIRRFEQREGVRVIRTYNGCGILVAQIKAGGRPDAYLTCDRSFLPPVADLFAHPPVEMSDSAIVILTAKGNPRGIRTLVDLGKPALRVGLANAEQSTLGALTRRLLEQQAVLGPVMSNVVSQAPTADLLVNQMRVGSLDATIVYLSNTTQVTNDLRIVPLDLPGATAVQTFSVAQQSSHKQLTGRLLAALRSPESRRIYESAGFHWREGTTKSN